jgi:hypothetical protein
MIILPYPPRRSMIASFWLTINIYLLSILIIMSFFYSSNLLLLVILFTLLSSLYIFFYCQKVHIFIYKSWNYIFSYVSLFFRKLILIMIYMMFSTLKFTGSKILERSCTGSMWVNISVDNDLFNKHPKHNYSSYRSLIKWSWCSKNIWFLFFIPFFLFLSFFDNGNLKHKRIDSNIYTLY